MMHRKDFFTRAMITREEGYARCQKNSGNFSGYDTSPARCWDKICFLMGQCLVW